MERTHEQVWQDTLVLRAQAADTEAMELLVGSWYRRLFGLALRLTGDREPAREACQEAWLAISNGIGRLEDPASFPAWARRIVANKCVDIIRRRGAKRLHEADGLPAEELAGVPQQSAGGQPGDIELIRSALRSMPADRRRLLSLYYLDSLSIARIAQLLGIPHGTVKSRLFHARTELKQLIVGEADD